MKFIKTNQGIYCPDCYEKCKDRVFGPTMTEAIYCRECFTTNQTICAPPEGPPVIDQETATHYQQMLDRNENAIEALEHYIECHSFGADSWCHETLEQFKVVNEKLEHDLFAFAMSKLHLPGES